MSGSCLTRQALEVVERPRVRALLAEAARTEEWPAAHRERLYAMVCADVAFARRNRASMAIAVAACLVAFLAGTWAASRPGPERLEPLSPRAALPSRPASTWKSLKASGLGLIEFDSATPLEVREGARERRLELAEGRFRALISPQDPRRPLVLLTPHLRVEVVGTRFDLHVTRERTRVEVLEGHVRVDSGCETVGLSGGESIDSDAPSLHPFPPAPPALSRMIRPAVSPPPRKAARLDPAAAAFPEASCSRESNPHRRAACLRKLSAGETLSAQNALFALAVLYRDELNDPDAALAVWREYERRFPHGPLAPEATLAQMELALRMNRPLEAIAAATSFERYEGDPRAARVSLARARLLCGPGGERALARALLERLAVGPDPVVGAEARALQRACTAPSFGPAGTSGLVPREVLPNAPPGH